MSKRVRARPLIAAQERRYLARFENGLDMRRAKVIFRDQGRGQIARRTVDLWGVPAAGGPSGTVPLMEPFDRLYGRARALEKHLVAWGCLLGDGTDLQRRCHVLEIDVDRLLMDIELACHAHGRMDVFQGEGALDLATISCTDSRGCW